VSANLYRIVQEALTNSAKHAGATRVVLQLKMREAEAGSDKRSARQIELAIDDDGRASDQAAGSGMGLLGMRERVAALGGRLSFEAGPACRSALRVVIPVGLAQSHAAAAECAA